MPNFNGIREVANNSNYNSTLNRAKTISVSKLEAINILDLVNDLGGETAIEEFSIFLGDTSDEQLRGMAAESILRFYANTRILASLLTRLFNSNQR